MHLTRTSYVDAALDRPAGRAKQASWNCLFASGDVDESI